MIKEIRLTEFKNISCFESQLDKINVIVGANNAGKSSVLQGIHFSIMAEVVRRKLQKTAISQDQLLYLPSSNVLALRHNEQYTVSTGKTSTLVMENESEDKVSITIGKGRNDGNVSVQTEGNTSFRQQVTSLSPLYSMYVPGVSGIPIREKYVTTAELRSAAARGDANMYIRNILYSIHNNAQLDLLNQKLQSVFPGLSVEVPYNPEDDLYVEVMLSFCSEGSIIKVPLEQCGTGMLQVLQIMAYGIYFTPKLLLLDEPDEHLHPNNQEILGKVLIEIAETEDMQILLCTHSRHLLSALSESAKIIWMSNGTVKEQDSRTEKYEILMDLGALDSFDRCFGGQYKYIFLTEDSDVKMSQLLLKHNGFTDEDTFVFTYKSCSKIDSAIMIADFIQTASPDCKIIIHRDRDFMTPQEAAYYTGRVKGRNQFVFLTDGSDIESYFTSVQHVAEVLDKSEDEISAWINDVIRDNQTEITVEFTHKRDECRKNPIYDNNQQSPPHTNDLLRAGITSEHVKGKYLKKKLQGCMQEKWGFQKNLTMVDSAALDVEYLKQIHSEAENVNME